MYNENEYFAKFSKVNESIFNHEFKDKGEWRQNEEKYKQDFIQVEFAQADGKWLCFNGNATGVSNLVKQFTKLGLQRYTDNASFELQQDVAPRRFLKGRIYKEFNDDMTDEERDDYIAYTSNQNLTGLNFTFPPRDINGCSIHNSVAKQLLVKWYPKHKARLMALSINPASWNVTLHVNPEGYTDWLHVLELFDKRYANFSLFKPRDKLIDKFGHSPYFLTELPLSCTEEIVLSIDLWRVLDFPKLVNLFCYPFANHDKIEPQLMLEASPAGVLELEAVLSSCITQFNTLNYLDYQISCSKPEYAAINYIKSALSIEDLRPGTGTMFSKIRFVFLRDPELYLLSVEYDPAQAIIYIFISYLQLFSLLDKIRAMQVFDMQVSYWWHIEYTDLRKFREQHDSPTGHLINIKYGRDNWHKFYKFMDVGCYMYGELRSISGLPQTQHWDHQVEQDDQYNLYRNAEHTFINCVCDFYILPYIAHLNPLREEEREREWLVFDEKDLANFKNARLVKSGELSLSIKGNTITMKDKTNENN